MAKNRTKITVHDIFKCILVLNLCRSVISDADPKFGDLYLKMCSILKIPRFCLSYMMASNPYSFYTLPLAPVPFPNAPFPVIVNPTSSLPSFTIPTVFTTSRPGGSSNMGPAGPSSAPLPALPPQVQPQLQPFPAGPQCPPSPPVCPPVALAMPVIDPRQGLRQFNGCPCIDPRGPIIEPQILSSGSTGSAPGGPGFAGSGFVGPNLNGPIPNAPQIPIRPARDLFARLNRAAYAPINNCEFSSHQCTHLMRCTYFENLYQSGADSVTVDNEVRKLFCGFDGYEVMICCPLSRSGVSLPVNPFYAASDAGFANSNGIIFSSINTNPHGSASNPQPSTTPIAGVVFSNPIQTQIAKPPDASVQLSNFNHAINFNPSYLQQTNLAALQLQTNPIKPQVSQSSSGLTFAPLVAAISLPIVPVQASNLSAQQIQFDNKVSPQPTPPPRQPPLTATTTTTTKLPSLSQELADHISLPANKCGITKYINSRVVGGTVTQPGQYPWLGALGYLQPNATTDGLQFYCAGSLITRSHVVSSAHCLNSYLKVVRLGEYDLSAQSSRSRMDFAVEWIKVHENYVSEIILNDIGIIKLRRQVPINDHIRPICLPLHDPIRSANFIGYAPIVAGWGSTSFGQPQSNILRNTQVKVIPTNECKKSYKLKYPSQVFDNRIICAGDSAHDSCHGDSGSGLMLGESIDSDPGYHYVLIGLVSYGYECARDKFPGVYTKISTFLPWIQRNLL